MYLKDKIFGFKTKNLYIGKLTTQIEEYDFKTEISTYTALVPKRNYVLVKVKNDFGKITCKDIFTKSVYNKVNQAYNENGDAVVILVSPAITTKRRIKYKDAEKLVDGLNFTDEEARIKVKR